MSGKVINFNSEKLKAYIGIFAHLN